MHNAFNLRWYYNWISEWPCIQHIHLKALAHCEVNFQMIRATNGNTAIRPTCNGSRGGDGRGLLCRLLLLVLCKQQRAFDSSSSPTKELFIGMWMFPRRLFGLLEWDYYWAHGEINVRSHTHNPCVHMFHGIFFVVFPRLLTFPWKMLETIVLITSSLFVTYLLMLETYMV